MAPAIKAWVTDADANVGVDVAPTLPPSCPSTSQGSLANATSTPSLPRRHLAAETCSIKGGSPMSKRADPAASEKCHGFMLGSILFHPEFGAPLILGDHFSSLCMRHKDPNENVDVGPKLWGKDYQPNSVTHTATKALWPKGWRESFIFKARRLAKTLRSDSSILARFFHSVIEVLRDHWKSFDQAHVASVTEFSPSAGDSKRHGSRRPSFRARSFHPVFFVWPLMLLFKKQKKLSNFSVSPELGENMVLRWLRGLYFYFFWCFHSRAGLIF